MMQNSPLAVRKAALAARAAIIQEIRRYFVEKGFLEVETPFRIPAPAPESHIDAVPAGNWFLQTSPELCMKRMLAAGYGRIFQICRCWRADERGSRHLSEFTMLEWYRSSADYTHLMMDCEELVRAAAKSAGHEHSLRLNGGDCRLDGAWERITVEDAFLRFTPLTMTEALASEQFDELMVTAIEPMLGLDRPTFIMDYPASRAALARLKDDDPAVAERFELYIGGLEIANAFSELTDPVEQRTRFLAEQKFRLSAGKTSYPLPERFLDELRTMPQAAGIALGIDRLVMALLGADEIDEVVAFTPEEL